MCPLCCGRDEARPAEDAELLDSGASAASGAAWRVRGQRPIAVGEAVVLLEIVVEVAVSLDEALVSVVVNVVISLVLVVLSLVLAEVDLGGDSEVVGP